MLKKIICAILAATAMLSFVACSNNKNADETKSNAEPTETVTEKVTQPVTEAQTEPATEEIKNNYVYFEDMVGTSLPDLIEEGYVYINYSKMDDSKECLFDFKMDNADSDTMKLIGKLEGKTVKELNDHNISIGYYLNEDKEYAFFTVIGSVQANFKIEGAAEVLKKQDKSANTELSKIKELQNLKLSEVELDGVTYTIKVNEPVNKTVLDDLDSIMYGDATEATEPVEPTEAVDPTQPTEPEKTPSMVLNGLTVAEFYYTPIPVDYLGA
ncbi:MAG: hypothetical protein UD936_11225 [Acutalibacteraceae bacterium]|nr:hypothetical protein [Acutalibacteraceae bacterium]